MKESIINCIAMLAVAFNAGCRAPEEPRIISIENEMLRVSINKTGAELWSITDKKTGTEYLWQGDPDYWDRRAPIMFPAVVRFREGRYTYKGQWYEMPVMGLAINADFKVVPSASTDMATHEYTSSEATLQNFPFPFCLRVTRSLEANRLHIRYTVDNTGNERMFFALGGHPGLMASFSQGLRRSDYQLTFPEPLTVNREEVDGGLLQNKRIAFLRNESALNLADQRIPFSGMVMTNVPARKIGVGYAGKPPYAVVDLRDFPNVNIYTPPDKPFVCIEPLVSHHDVVDSSWAIEEKNHLIKLEPGDSKTYCYTIIIQPENMIPPDK